MASLKERVQHIAEGKGRRSLDLLSDVQPRMTYTRLDEIETDADQPRKDMGDLEGLKDSIRAYGILLPLIVSPLQIGRFRLISGERRLTAAKAMGLLEVPTIVRTVEDHERLALQIIENLHRKDLNPIEEATSYQRLIEEFTLSQEEVAKRIGKSKAHVNQMLRLLSLPDSILEDVQTSEQISKSVMLEIAKEPVPEKQERLWEAAKNGELTVKQAREAKKIETHPVGKWQPESYEPEHYAIVTEKAIVRVQFPQRKKPTNEDITEVLEQALASHRRSYISGLEPTPPP